MKHKLIIVLALIVAGGVWWGLAGSSSSGSSTSLLTTQGADTRLSPADQALIATLLQLRAVKLDGTVLSEPAFLALRDFSTQIIPEPVGRPNPFAPMSVQATSSSAAGRGSSIFTPGR